MRKALPCCLGWDSFVKAWKSNDLILVSSQNVHDREQELLFQRHKNHFQDTLVPLLYHHKDTRKQNIQVTIPGTAPVRTGELVLNEIVDTRGSWRFKLIAVVLSAFAAGVGCYVWLGAW